MKKDIIVFFTLLFIVASIILVNPCLADETEEVSGFNQAGQDGSQTAGTVSLKNPLAGAGVNDIRDLVGQIIKTLLSIVGSLALLMFVYGGLIWMTAAGNEDKIKKGKGILMWAVIGLVVIFASYTILEFVVGIFGAT